MEPTKQNLTCRELLTALSLIHSPLIVFARQSTGSAPVLILTGEWDPVTPPTNGAAIAQFLPNSLHIVVPYGAHDFGDLEGIACLDRLLSEFVETGTAKGLDTSCVKNIRRKGFALKRPDQR